MVFTLIQQGLGLRPREKRALCGKMGVGHYRPISKGLAFSLPVYGKAVNITKLMTLFV